jgi:hypothetical protein
MGTTGMKRVQSRFGIVVLLSVLCLVGCDVIRGVSRRASLPSLPPSSCVIRSLESVQGVTNVSYKPQTGGTPITWTGTKPSDMVHYYFYDFQGLSGNLYFLKDYKGRVEFSQGYITVNKPVPQAEIDILRPVMRQLEQRLEAECGLYGLVANIKETCSGVTCPN